MESKMVQTEIGLLPEDWEVVLIGDGSDLDGGLAFKSSLFKTSGEYQVIKMANLYNGSLDLTRNVSYVSIINLAEEKYLTTEGDVLISLTGTTGKRDYGYTVYIKGNKKLLVNQRVGRIKSKENVISKYLYYFTKSIFFDHQFYELAKGGTGNQTNVSISDLKSLKIPLPPLPEQEAIASALSDADSWIESLEKLIAKKRLIKQGAMQELLTPKEDWEVKKLGEVVDFCDNERRPIKSSDRQSGVYPYYGASGIIDFVSDYIFDGEYLLLGEDGENILSRNLPLIYYVNQKCWVNNHAHVLKCKEFIEPKFLMNLLESLDFKNLNSGTAQPKLNKENCFNILLNIPSLPEQTRIATILSDMDAELEALDIQLEKAKKIKQGMMQELLTGRIRLV